MALLGILAPGVSRPGPLNSTTTWIVIAAFNAASLAFWFQNARADKAELSLGRLLAAGLGKTAAPELLPQSIGAPAESSRPVG